MVTARTTKWNHHLLPLWETGSKIWTEGVCKYPLLTGYIWPEVKAGFYPNLSQGCPLLVCSWKGKLILHRSQTDDTSLLRNQMCCSSMDEDDTALLYPLTPSLKYRIESKWSTRKPRNALEKVFVLHLLSIPSVGCRMFENLDCLFLCNFKTTTCLTTCHNYSAWNALYCYS